MDIQELIKHLDNLIHDCRKQEDDLEKIGLDCAAACSSSMALAYENVRNFIDSGQKSNPPMGRDDIETIIVEIMTQDGPDGHTDGCDVITDFIVDLQNGNQQVWIDKYLPKKIRSNTFLFDTSCLKDQISKISETPPYYAIGVVYYKNEFTYCLTRKINEVVDILMLKKMSDKAKFDEEVKNLSQYFNADIFEDQTH